MADARPLPFAEEPRWPHGIQVRAFKPGNDEQEWLGVNNRAFAADPDQGGWTLDTLEDREEEPWFDPSGFLLALDDRGMAGFCWTKLHDAAPPVEPEPLGEIYVIGVEPDRQGSGLGRALTVAGLASIHERGPSIGMLFVDRSEHRRRRPLPRARLRADADRPRVRTGTRMTTRYGADQDAVRALLDEWGEPRYRADQVWDALYRQRIPLDDATALSKALRGKVAEALPLALASTVEQTATDGMTTKWLWSAGDDGAQVETVLDAHRVAGDGLHLLPSRLRDGVHVLRDGPGRVRAPPRRRRDRRAGRACAARLSPARVQRGVHGDG